MTGTPVCTLCGHDMTVTLRAGVMACENCDLHKYMSRPMSKQERMRRRAEASDAVIEHRRGQ